MFLLVQLIPKAFFLVEELVVAFFLQKFFFFQEKIVALLFENLPLVQHLMSLHIFFFVFPKISIYALVPFYFMIYSPPDCQRKSYKISSSKLVHYIFLQANLQQYCFF